MTEMQRREGLRPSRRSVVRGVAWSIPVVSVAAAAPAFALSPCLPQSVIWSTKSGPLNNSSIASESGTSLVTVSITSSGATGAAQNLNSSVGTQGNRTSNLQLVQNSGSPSAVTQTATLTFSQDVTNLSFTLLDIDSIRVTNFFGQVTQSFWDSVTLTGAFSSAPSAGSSVGGNGTSTPFQINNNNNNAGTNSTLGNVDVNYPGTVRSITITYTSASNVVGSNPVVAIGDLTFQRVTC